jgi:hypothetical protein
MPDPIFLKIRFKNPDIPIHNKPISLRHRSSYKKTARTILYHILWIQITLSN